ncbi:MAG: FRG domain-containing protein [Chthoniobacteraceae bacterium]
MAKGRKPRWNISPVKNGIVTVELFKWDYFNDYIFQELLDYTGYVFRGHRCDNWNLESTLDRVTSQSPRRHQHLTAFKLAVRGRRGPNPAKLETENDWWALGQHHGLKTPLLDWTKSPFVAAYFAFAGDRDKTTPRRVVWALSRVSVERKSKQIQEAFTKSGRIGRAPIVEFFTPLSDENARLVNQGGLFSRAPDGVTIEDWMEENFPDSDPSANRMIAIKITIPNHNRTDALRSLNRMNINHLTLFPDLYGASAFCNTELEIAKY